MKILKWIKDILGMGLTKEQKEWDKKLLQRWYDSYVTYLQYRMTTYTNLHEQAKVAFNKLMKYPGMFHDKKKGEELRTSFMIEENHYPVLIIWNERKEIPLKLCRSSIYLTPKIIDFLEYKRLKGK